MPGCSPKRLGPPVLAHLESCADCRWVLAAGEGAEALSSAPEVVAKEPLPSLLVPGTRVSRYVVRERLGSGAMGVVYAADDPELGRRVALKMLRPEGHQREELQQRLLREAQALARLAHPNVVTLYDVGTHGDGVFLAMELVEGTTLAEWMKQPRPWKEVLRVFLEAGKGLAAAHAAGLVHRDFKPANTLLGKEGRVFVTDFGIAGPLHQDAGAPLRRDDNAPVASLRNLTRTGQLLGTPAYMAPELMRGQRADARSDAFSFCVALHEALFGVRPFQGETLKELAQAALQGSISPPKYEVKIPARVRRALLRGLRSSPEERFPSMESLLAELSPRPIRWLARMMATAAAAGILGTRWPTERRIGRAVTASRKWRNSRRPGAPRDASGSAPLSSPRARPMPPGPGSSSRRCWTPMPLSGGRFAPRPAGPQAMTPAINAWQTAACLDARLWQLAAVTEVLEKADVQTVQNAQRADHLPRRTRQLPGRARPLRPTAAARKPPRPVDAARHKLAQARAHLCRHRFKEGLAVTSALIEELKGLDYRPLEAEMLLAHGVFLGGLNKPKEAEAFLYQALWAGEAARDDETVARAWLELIWAVGEEQSRPDEAEKLVRHARAAIERLGRKRFPDITTDLHMRLSSLRESHGQLAEAEQEALQGLEFSRRRNGPDSLRTPNFLHQLDASATARAAMRTR